MDIPRLTTLIEIEHRYLLGGKPPEEPVKDRFLVAGLLYEGWASWIGTRFAHFSEEQKFPEIRVGNFKNPIPVQSTCLKQLFDERLLRGPFEPGVRLRLTNQGCRVVAKEWFPEDDGDSILENLVRGTGSSDIPILR